MNLQENIYRVQSLIYEDNLHDKIRNLIEKVGLLSVVKTFGPGVVSNILTKEEKVKFIKDKVIEITDELGTTGFDVQDFYKPPVFYSENEFYEKEIYFFSKEYLYVDVFEKNKERGTFTEDIQIQYKFLPDDVLNRVFEFLVDINE
jgi:hypothetical protein